METAPRLGHLIRGQLFLERLDALTRGIKANMARHFLALLATLTYSLQITGALAPPSAPQRRHLKMHLRFPHPGWQGVGRRA